MTVTWVNYTLKDPDVQVLVVTDLNETADWIEANLVDPNVNRSLINYGTLFFVVGGNTIAVNVGTCLVVDSNGKIFKLSKEIVDAFYDPTP